MSEEVARGTSKQSRTALAESGMPPECTEFGARRFKIKERQRQALGSLPSGCLDDYSVAASISQRMVFWVDFGWEKNLHTQPRIGLVWHRVAGLLFFGWSSGGGL